MEPSSFETKYDSSSISKPFEDYSKSDQIDPSGEDEECCIATKLLEENIKSTESNTSFSSMIGRSFKQDGEHYETDESSETLSKMFSINDNLEEQTTITTTNSVNDDANNDNVHSPFTADLLKLRYRQQKIRKFGRFLNPSIPKPASSSNQQDSLDHYWKTNFINYDQAELLKMHDKSKSNDEASSPLTDYFQQNILNDFGRTSKKIVIKQNKENEEKQIKDSKKKILISHLRPNLLSSILNGNIKDEDSTEQWTLRTSSETLIQNNWKMF